MSLLERYKRKFIAIFFLLLMINPLYNTNQFIINSVNQNQQSSESKNKNPLNPSDMSEEGLIDGILKENTKGIATTNESFSLGFNNSVLTHGLTVDVLNINETKEYIQNGNFDTDMDNWNVKQDTDVNKVWNTNYLGKSGVGSLNLTGLEQKHPFSRYNDSGNYLDNISSQGDWLMANETLPEDDQYHGFLIPRFNPPSSTFDFELSWCVYATSGKDGYRSGLLFSNFTYNGTEHLTDVELSFEYKMEIKMFAGCPAGSVGDMNLSVWIVDPVGQEFQIDSWKEHFRFVYQGEVNVSTLDWRYKTFNLNHLNNIFRTTGNYTLKFKSEHFHDSGGSGAKIYTKTDIDNVKFILNYTKKEFPIGYNASLYQSSSFGKIPNGYALLNLNYSISEPFSALNDSGAELFVNLNNYTLYSKKINETNYNQWNNLQINIENSKLAVEFINLSIGINFTKESVTFYPNQSWTLFLDNVSLIIRAIPKVSQINLSFFITDMNKTYLISGNEFGKGQALVSNNSIVFIGNSEIYNIDNINQYSNWLFQFNCNSSNVTIEYNITKFGLTWRDAVYCEMRNMTQMITDYLDSCLTLITSSVFPRERLSRLTDIINLTRQDDILNAIKYASSIDEQFPIMLQSLYSLLNGTLYDKVYNPMNQLDYFDDINPVKQISSGIFSNITQLFANIWNNIEYFNMYDFADNIIINQFIALYNSYKVSTNNKLEEIRNNLISINLNSAESNLLNLSTIYNNLLFVQSSLNLAVNNLSAFVNIDPLNALKSWGNMGSIGEIISAKSFNGIFLGNIPMIADICSNLYMKTTSQSWKYSIFYEYLSSKDKNSDVNENINSGLLPLSGNPFGVYGSLISDNIMNDPFSIDYSGEDYSYDDLFSNKIYYKNTTPIKAETLIDYYLLLFLIEDVIVRRNCPLILDYCYKSVRAIVDKTTQSNEDSQQFSKTNYRGSVQINTPNTILDSSDAYSDLLIQNLGNGTSVKLVQKYYLPSQKGLFLVNEHYINLIDMLNANEILSARVPLISSNILYLANFYSYIDDITNISLNYYLIQEVYFGNTLISTSFNYIFYNPEMDNVLSCISSLYTKLEENFVKIFNSTELYPNINADNLNLSKLIYSTGLNFDTIKDLPINIIIQRNDTDIKRIGNFYMDCLIGTRYIGSNRTNPQSINNFQSIKLQDQIYTGLKILSFRISDVLTEAGLSVTSANFERFFIFNLSSNLDQSFIPIFYSILIKKQLDITPIWFKEFTVNVAVSDQDDFIQLFIPFLEISSKGYYKVTVTDAIYNERYFLGYPTVNNPPIQISGSNYNINIKLYLRSLKIINSTQVTIQYIVKLSNGSEFQSSTVINIKIYQIFHFNPPISPNLFVVLLIGGLVLVTQIFIRRFFKRFYISIKLSNTRNYIDI